MKVNTGSGMKPNSFRPYFPRLRIESSFLDGSLTRRARPLYSDAMTIQPGLISIVVAAGVLAAQPKQTSAASQQVGPHLGDKAYGEAISSEGRYIGIEEHGRITVQDLRTLEEHVVIGVFNSSKEKFDSPFISPDGKQLACLRVLPEGPADLCVLAAD